MADNETIADLIAWLRKPREGENAYLTLWRDEIADRLEAAHKCEREADKRNAGRKVKERAADEGRRKVKTILDACCGSRMFWFNPKNPNVLFIDNRRLETQAIWKSGNGKVVRYCTVDPDLLADFRNLPFPDESFWHVVFDPPHLNDIGDSAWMAKKYGRLPKDWKPLIHDGFHECWRVLKPNGTLIFKWNETQIPVREVIDAIGVEPLYGHKSGRASKTHWMAFVKIQEGGAK